MTDNRLDLNTTGVGGHGIQFLLNLALAGIHVFLWNGCRDIARHLFDDMDKGDGPTGVQQGFGLFQCGARGCALVEQGGGDDDGVIHERNPFSVARWYVNRAITTCPVISHLDIGQTGGSLPVFHVEISRDTGEPCVQVPIRAFRHDSKPH